MNFAGTKRAIAALVMCLLLGLVPRRMGYSEERRVYQGERQRKFYRRDNRHRAKRRTTTARVNQREKRTHDADCDTSIGALRLQLDVLLRVRYSAFS